MSEVLLGLEGASWAPKRLSMAMNGTLPLLRCSALIQPITEGGFRVSVRVDALVAMFRVDPAYIHTIMRRLLAMDLVQR